MASLLVVVIYLIFISLGLPDSLLGSGWPVMQHYFNVPSSYAGYVSMTISFMTIFSALLSPMIIKRLHTKYIVIVSIALTILGLLGFSFSTSFAMLFLFAVPYGLGAGAIDASVNHYVANNYSGVVMNFLHCFYGLGAVISPIIMGQALKYAHWNQGYQWTAFIQIFILATCVFSLPLWKKNDFSDDGINEESAGLSESFFVPGVIFTLIAFFAYCSGEATCFLWTASYFKGLELGNTDSQIAITGSLIFGGLMLGRIIAGFITNKLGDKKLIRLGIICELIGIIIVMLSKNSYILSCAGFVIIGTGMGPIYPAIQHMAPENFGKKYSAAVIGMQMASAYVGSTFMPMIFGQIQQYIGITSLPIYVLIFALINIFFIEWTYTKCDKQSKKA